MAGSYLVQQTHAWIERLILFTSECVLLARAFVKRDSLAQNLQHLSLFRPITPPSPKSSTPVKHLLDSGSKKGVLSKKSNPGIDLLDFDQSIFAHLIKNTPVEVLKTLLQAMAGKRWVMWLLLCWLQLHRIFVTIRRIKWRKTYISQTVFNSFTITPECLSRHLEFYLLLHTREFNLTLHTREFNLTLHTREFNLTLHTREFNLTLHTREFNLTLHTREFNLTLHTREFNLTLHTREFNLSHMPNPLGTNRIK